MNRDRDRVFWAGWLAVAAGGMGFAIRGGVLLQWARQYDFSLTQLGVITGCGLSGFGAVMAVFGVVARLFNGRQWLAVAVGWHVISAAVMLAPGADFNRLCAGLFLFAMGNGLAEGATYLMAQGHGRRMGWFGAAWPAGMLVGAVAAALMHYGPIGAVGWRIQMGLFLAPSLACGVTLIGTGDKVQGIHNLPDLNSPKQRLSLGLELGDRPGGGGPILLLAGLVVLQGLQGWLEFGVTSWLSTMEGRVFDSPREGLLILAFVYLFVLAARPFSNAIQRRAPAWWILLAGAALSWAALLVLGNTTSLIGVLGAAVLYAAGTAYSWPTLLSLTAKAWPRWSAQTFAVLSAAGMLMAGLLAAPALGYAQETHAVRKLMPEHPEIYQEYKSTRVDHVLSYYTTTLDAVKAANASVGDKTILREAETHGCAVAWRMTAVVPALQVAVILCLMLFRPEREPIR